MRRFAWILLLVPATVFALDYAPSASEYADAPFSRAESAGISVLTNLGAVSGNPDGTFAANRTLNRAEFLKIVLMSWYEEVESYADTRACFPDDRGNPPTIHALPFPDVAKTSWYWSYVCAGVQLGLVQGYPDGFFRPGNAVNYAESLKILTLLYKYHVVSDVGEPWYLAFVRGAEDHGTLLPVDLDYGAFLKRGQMARLAAGFRAEFEGELDAYRDAERGVIRSSSSSTSSSSSSSSSSSVSSASSASSESSASSSSSFSLPAQSHLLLVGRVTPPIADATFTSPDMDVGVRAIRIKMRRKITSLQNLIVVDAAGNPIATMKIDQTDTEERKWYADLPADALSLDEDVVRTFGVLATLKQRGQGGVSGELVELERFAFVVQSTDGATSWEMLATATNFPKHHTAQGLLTEVSAVGDATGTINAGTNKRIGTFAFEGTALPDTPEMDLEQVTFSLEYAGVGLSNVQLGAEGTQTRVPCQVSGTNPAMIDCTTIPAELQSFLTGPRALSLYATVAVTPGADLRMIQAKILDPGTIAAPGSVAWNDGSGHFRWLEQSAPLAVGTRFTVEP